MNIAVYNFQTTFWLQQSRATPFWTATPRLWRLLEHNAFRLSQTLELPQFSNLLIGPATAGLELYLPILDTHHPHFGHPFRCSTISLRGCFDPPSGTGGTTPQPFWTHFGHPSPSFWTPRLLDCFSRVYNVQISFSLTNDPAPAGSFWTIWTPLCRIILNPFSHGGIPQSRD